jgi:hypothetical protein
MRRYENYDSTEAINTDRESLEPGGYICRILRVQSEEKEYGTLLRIAFDIDEGDHKGYYRRMFNHKCESNPAAKWSGMYYQTVKEDDLRYFKGFITAIENSNKGYTWDWDEKKLVGKIFGGVFGQEEFQKDGKILLTTRCRFVRSVDQIRKGVTIPSIKRLDATDIPDTDEGDDDFNPFK